MASKSRPGTEKTARLAVAAIDFGTTCTGYAYFLRSDSKHYIRDINIDQKWTAGDEIGLQAPTTVLMEPSKKFHSFGFEAENKYKLLTLESKHRDWYYFRHFKMRLHHEQELTRDMLLADAEGKHLKAMLIFTEAIQYVKKHLLNKLKVAVGSDIDPRDIQWVLTVPAIWRESAKQFMRESASKAGIPNEQLTLALEPESAAIFCKELALTCADGVDGSFLSSFNPGEKYVIVDLGGGTMDTTGHEVMKDGCLKELHAATGGPWGGQQVNEAFERFIKELVSQEVFEQFCKDCTSDWIEFEKNFEKKKRQLSIKPETVDLNFPTDLEKLYTKKTGLDLKVKVTEKFGNNVKLIKHSMLLDHSIVKSFFDDSVNPINKHLDRLVSAKELKSVSTLLLVGGFSESEIVSNAIQKYFKKLRVIAPRSGSVAILKGAVMFGIDPMIIASRISPYTYGVHTRKRFIQGVHPEEKKRTLSDGRTVVDNAFDKHLEIGETVYVGDKRSEKNYIISNKTRTKLFWKVYSSKEKDPKFCDECGCRYIGKLSITIPEQASEKQKVTLNVSMTCRGTELEAKAIAKECKISCKCIFEFLEKTDELGSVDYTETAETAQ